MKQRIVILLLVGFTSCVKLDNNLYNNDNEISSYLFDDYTGEQDFVLDASYDIPPAFKTLLTLPSQAANESEPTSIKAVYIGDVNRINTDTVILYCHGNKWHMDFYWQRAKLLAHVNGKNHYGVMMMDYRGYGLSEGSPTEEGMYADVNSSMAWLKSKGLANERLVIYGFSLGSAPACELSANNAAMAPSKLILEAPFASSEVMVHDAAQLNMPGSYFTSLKIDNAEEIKKVRQPFLWLHGLNDNFLSFKTHGQVVFDNYQGSYKHQYLVEGADHGEVPEKMGFETYLKTLKEFILK